MEDDYKVSQSESERRKLLLQKALERHKLAKSNNISL